MTTLAAVAPAGGAGPELVRGPRPAPGAYAAKTRYRQQDAACTLETSPDGMACNSRSPMGGDPGPERGAVRRRGLPGGG